VGYLTKSYRLAFDVFMNGDAIREALIAILAGVLIAVVVV
jgi:hypothetical protein